MDMWETYARAGRAVNRAVRRAGTGFGGVDRVFDVPGVPDERWCAIPRGKTGRGSPRGFSGCRSGPGLVVAQDPEFGAAARSRGRGRGPGSNRLPPGPLKTAAARSTPTGGVSAGTVPGTFEHTIRATSRTLPGSATRGRAGCSPDQVPFACASAPSGSVRAPAEGPTAAAPRARSRPRSPGMWSRRPGSTRAPKTRRSEHLYHRRRRH